jgi:tRNA threonylcarbamoyladenosine biosynthesis protein TsaE
MEVIFKLTNIRDAAKQLLSLLRTHPVMALHGEMGAGKTTLVHAVCEEMGVKGNISSPTFSIINQYTTGNNETIYHIDLYRLKDETEAINAGVEDCLFSGNPCLVEWPERAPGIFPDNTLHLYLTTITPDTRKLAARDTSL